MKDLLGKALEDYISGNDYEDPTTETTHSDPEAFPIDYFLRDFDEMPAIEQKALQLSKGKILDVGCGAGAHALYLESDPNLKVIAVDLSPRSVAIAKNRGVSDARCVNVYDLEEGNFDTILMLMNGSGVFGRREEVAENLKKLTLKLAPGGQLLIDSSDLIYLFEEDEDGGVWIPGNRYYGELDFTVHYKGESETFPWLYLDYDSLEETAISCGLQCEKIMEGEHYDYLARITLCEAKQ